MYVGIFMCFLVVVFWCVDWIVASRTHTVLAVYLLHILMIACFDTFLLLCSCSSVEFQLVKSSRSRMLLIFVPDYKICYVRSHIIK